MERGTGTCRTDASPHPGHALHQEQHRAPADSGALHPPVAMECPALPIVLPTIPHQINDKGSPYYGIIQKYRMIQYNMMFDKKNRRDSFFEVSK